MRVILADDQGEIRSGLRLLLEQEPGFSVVGEVTEISDLYEQVRSTSPDLVLLDWELAVGQVTGLIPMLRSICPDLRIIALSGRPEARKAALSAGADAFVSKGDQPERLLAVVHATVQHSA